MISHVSEGRRLNWPYGWLHKIIYLQMVKHLSTNRVTLLICTSVLQLIITATIVHVSLFKHCDLDCSTTQQRQFAVGYFHFRVITNRVVWSTYCSRVRLNFFAFCSPQIHDDRDGKGCRGSIVVYNKPTVVISTSSTLQQVLSSFCVDDFVLISSTANKAFIDIRLCWKMPHGPLWKCITHCNTARRLPSHGNRGWAQKIWWRLVQRFQRYARGQTHTQTDRNTPLPYRAE